MLLSKMAASKDLTSWNDRGKFLYKGQPIAGSHMYDLVKGLTHPKTLSQQKAPRGWEQFLHADAELNIPSTIVGSSDHRHQLKLMKDPKSGAAKASVPSVFHTSPLRHPSPFFPLLSPQKVPGIYLWSLKSLYLK